MTSIGQFEPVPSDLINRSEFPPDQPLRPFAAWRVEDGVYLYLNEEPLRVNGEIVNPRITSADPSAGSAVLTEGDYWCFIYKRTTDIEADAYDVYDAVIAPKSVAASLDENIVYCFRVIEVFADLSFQQYAYGTVVISGLPEDTSRIAPFYVTTVGYRDDVKADTRYFVYVPSSPVGCCAKYNGYDCEVINDNQETIGVGGMVMPVYTSDVVEFFVDESGRGSVYGVVTTLETAWIKRYYLEITQTPNDVQYTPVSTFKIADIAPNGNTPPIPEGEGEFSESISFDEEYDVRLSTQAVCSDFMSVADLPATVSLKMSPNDIGYRTLLRPFCITSFESSDLPDWSGRPMMYLPKESVLLNSEFVEIVKTGGIQGDLMLLTPGNWWCVILGDENEDATEGGGSAPQAYSEVDVMAKNMTAVIMKSDDYPKGENIFFAFKVAEVYSEYFGEGAFQEFAYGQVCLTVQSWGIHRIAPFEVITLTYVSADALQTREYYVYTPEGQTLTYKGEPVDIEGSDGGWTKVPIDNGAKYFGQTIWCYREVVSKSAEDPTGTRNAKFTTDSRRVYSGEVEFFFPVAHIGPGEIADDKAPKMVLVGVEETENEKSLPGARVDIENMARLYSRHLSNGVVLIDDGATVEAVKEAIEWAVSDSEVAVLYFSCHGGCDDAGNNHILLYDGRLTDAVVWELIENAECPVHLIFDCCESGTMYGPPSTPMPNAVKGTAKPSGWAVALHSKALKSGTGIQMLCWSAATDSTLAWGNIDTGGQLTSAIVRYAKDGTLYNEIWHKVKRDLMDREAPYDQTPVSTEFGSFWSGKKFFLD